MTTRTISAAWRCALFSVALAGPVATAAAETRMWSTTGAGAKIVATDCTDCGDDIGLMLTCERPGQSARVTVHWAAADMRQNAPLEFRIGADAYRYTPNVTLYGAIGHTPEVRIAPGDPLLGALQTGRAAEVRFGTVRTEIGLAGSRPAIERFLAQCGFSPAAAVPIGAPPPAVSVALAAPVQMAPTPLAPNAPAPAAQLAQQLPPPPQSQQWVTVIVRNGLGQRVDYYAVDAAGTPHFLATLEPGQAVSQPSRPGVKLVFGVAQQQVAAYVTTAAPNQDYTIGAVTTGPLPPPPGAVPPQATSPTMAPVVVTPAAPPAVAAPRAAAPAGAPAEPELDDDGAVWNFAKRGATVEAIFGIPETDATSIALRCAPGRGPLAFEVFSAPARRSGQSVSLRLVGPGGAATLSGNANPQGRPTGAIEPGGGTLVQMLRGTGRVTITLDGRAAGQFLGLASNGAGREFLRSCRQLGG